MVDEIHAIRSYALLMKRLILLGCFTYLMLGFGQLAIGAVMEPMVHSYDIRYGDGGRLVMNQFLGGMVGILFAPSLMRRLGKKAVLIGAIGIVAVAEFLYASLPPWHIMLLLAPFAGMGLGIAEAVVGSFVIDAAGAQANTAMSRLELFFGVGALLIPFAGAALIEAGEWRLSFGIVSGLSAVAVLLWFFWWPSAMARSASSLASPGESAGNGDAVFHADSLDDDTAVVERQAERRAPSRGRAALILAACALFFAVYVGLEMSFIHYLPSILVKSNGVTEASATLTLSLFWGAMVIGRLCAGQLADRFGGSAYLLGTCGAAAILLILMTFFTGDASVFALTFALGLMMSGMFAISLVFANRAVPGATERTTSLLMACGGIGGALLPECAGWFLDHQGIGATRWLFAATSLTLLLVMLSAVLVSSRSGRSRNAAAPANEPANEPSHSL